MTLTLIYIPLKLKLKLTTGEHQGDTQLVITVGTPRPAGVHNCRLEINRSDNSNVISKSISSLLAQLYHDIRASVCVDGVLRRDLTESVRAGVYNLLGGRSSVILGIVVKYETDIRAHNTELDALRSRDCATASFISHYSFRGPRQVQRRSRSYHYQR